MQGRATASTIGRCVTALIGLLPPASCRRSCCAQKRDSLLLLPFLFHLLVYYRSDFQCAVAVKGKSFTPRAFPVAC